MTLALYGKHPGWGDFVQAGLPLPLLAPLESWLDAVMTETRAALGPDWEPVWDRDGTARPVLRFWLGEELWGQPVCGVMAASRDRVGRRFPLLMLAAGCPVPPPVLDPVQAWYDAAEAHLRGRLSDPAAGGAPAALLDGLDVPESPDVLAVPGPSGFWAMGVPQDLAALMADIAATDHRRAAGGRSYWWRAGHAGAGEEMGDEAAAQGLPEELPLPEDAPPFDAAVDPEDVAEPAGPAEAMEKAAEEAAADAETPSISAEGGRAPEDALDALWRVETDMAPSLPDIAPPAGSHQAHAAGAGVLAQARATDAWAGDAWLDPAVPEDPVDFLAPVGAPSAPLTAAPPKPRAEPVRASQVYAGPGLPDGAVLAWLLRGEATG